MISILIVVAGLAIDIQTATPQDLEIITERQQAIRHMGGAARGAGNMLRDEAPFDPAAVQALLEAFAETAGRMPALFAEDSKRDGDAKALSAIWENKADIDARSAVNDLAPFAATMPAIFNKFDGCREKYRAGEN
jgi:cytochrome c556